MSDPRIELDPSLRTIKSKIMDVIKGVLEEAPFLDGTDIQVPGYLRLFDIVKKGTMDDISVNETPCCAIEEGGEEPKPLIYSKTDKKFRLFVNVKIVKGNGIDPCPMINYYFGRVVQILVSDPHVADLANDVSEAGNSIENLGDNDPEPGGTLYLDVEYRHARENPFME